MIFHLYQFRFGRPFVLPDDGPLRFDLFFVEGRLPAAVFLVLNLFEVPLLLLLRLEGRPDDLRGADSLSGLVVLTDESALAASA